VSSEQICIPHRRSCSVPIIYAASRRCRLDRWTPIGGNANNEYSGRSESSRWSFRDVNLRRVSSPLLIAAEAQHRRLIDVRPGHEGTGVIRRCVLGKYKRASRHPLRERYSIINYPPLPFAKPVRVSSKLDGCLFLIRVFGLHVKQKFDNSADSRSDLFKQRLAKFLLSSLQSPFALWALRCELDSIYWFFLVMLVCIQARLKHVCYAYSLRCSLSRKSR